MTIINEKNGIALIQIGQRFFVVGIDRNRGQVTSCLSSDSPGDGGAWFAGISERGVQYVANGRTKSAACSAFRRMTRTECQDA